MTYLANFDVVYSTQAAQEPPNTVTDLNNSGNDINKGFHGEYVYLTPITTNNPNDAATSFKIVIQSHADPEKKDLAKGAGGDYRYVIPMRDPGARKITSARLLRSGSKQDYPPSGFNGLSTDINQGRKGDYLYIVWKSA
ncbi:hypothetical protein VNI00_012889 [Paramarasmius palmivorus]|uniref:Uncharacterized protein n=1 Tax=Paramarasmius palmivorus TaxID=297713 RepID=A0AAW0BZS8_9AGAR